MTSRNAKPDYSTRVVAMLRLPGKKVTAFASSSLPENSHTSVSCPSNRSFLYAPFNESAEETLILPHPLTQAAAEEQIHNIAETLPDISLPKNTSPADYFENAQRLLDTLRNSELKKAILSKIIRRKLPTAFSTIKLFEVLCEKYPAATIHLLAIEGREIWIGASPELLLNIKEDKLFTVSLAGTLPLHHHKAETLTWGEKEIEEQAIVTQHVDDVLHQNNAIYDVEQGKTFSVAAGNIAHLKTEFRARISGEFERKTLLSELHPTPAIGGWPRDLAQKAIEQFEGHERSYYGGYFGVTSADETHLYLNLRCVRITKNHMQFYVGGGYTAQSDPQVEWDETEHKAKTLLSVIENL